MSEKIVFFGSGPVAAESLKLLLQDFTIEAVVTKPRPAHHRGSVPVIDVAVNEELPLMTAANAKELDALFAQKPFKSRVGVLIDFGIFVPKEVLDYFPKGIVNSHFSLLPQWRGADPITFSILSGQKQTGVSLMLVVEEMDQGPILAQATYDLPPDITTPRLTSDLIELSHALLSEILPVWVDDAIDSVPQSLNPLTAGLQISYSRKLTKDDGQLDWSKPAMQLEREVRAYQGWPKSTTSINGIDFTVTLAHTTEGTGTPGTPTVIEKMPAIYTADGVLVIDELKPANKQKMTGQAFLAGYKNKFLS